MLKFEADGLYNFIRELMSNTVFQQSSDKSCCLACCVGTDGAANRKMMLVDVGVPLLGACTWLPPQKVGQTVRRGTVFE